MSQLGKPVDPNWVRNEKGKFFRFINLNPQEQNLEGQTAVFIIWHGGVRPAWVYVGTSRNLARDLQECKENEDQGLDHGVWTPLCVRAGHAVYTRVHSSGGVGCSGVGVLME